MTSPDVTIREATARDAEAICGIYNPCIRNTIISFEETDVPVREMTERLEAVTSTLPWLVVARAGRVAGYAYASKWHGRAAYRHSVETTIYIEEAARGRGLGSELYCALLARLRAMSLRTALGVIALPNAASVALHEKCGFRKVAHLEAVGFKFGQWIDVGCWQIIL
jgi:L-amino acid N-acyltransferase YncA